MTATNHVLTGTLTGLTIHQPFLAIPLALASHFVLDALPHYGNKSHTQKKFITVLGIDTLLATLVLALLTVLQPAGWPLGLICAVIAASPDVMWLPLWLRELNHLPAKTKNNLIKFHENIQRLEKPQNYPFELLWASLCIFILVVSL